MEIGLRALRLVLTFVAYIAVILGLLLAALAVGVFANLQGLPEVASTIAAVSYAVLSWFGLYVLSAPAR